MKRAAWRAVTLLLAIGAGCSEPGREQPSSSAPVRDVRVEAPKISYPVPAFELIDHRGGRFTRESLPGKVWVFDFIFTRCPSVCPRMTEQMAKLARTFAAEPRVGFVSVSVDPENDTPEALTAFARKHGAEQERWFFLTGDLATVEKTVLGGFKIALGKEATGSLTHGEKFVVVDDKATIVSYFDPDEAGLVAIEKRLRELL